VALHHYLRPELHFSSLDDMVEQMHRDCADARAKLSG
jgi:FAD synthase